jgi:hypothetical protein
MYGGTASVSKPSRADFLVETTTISWPLRDKYLANDSTRRDPVELSGGK